MVLLLAAMLDHGADRRRLRLIAFGNRPSIPLEAGALSAEIERMRADAKQAVAERDSKLALVAQLENQQKLIARQQNRCRRS